MTFEAIYFAVVIGLGIICVVIGFLSGPNRLKKPVPVPAVSAVPNGNTADLYTSFDYQGEEQNFRSEVQERLLEVKTNCGENYLTEKQERDVIAFSEYCNAGFLKIMPEVPDNEGN